MKELLREGVVIVDYGSQYTLLIARRVRELGVYSEVLPWDSERLRELIDGEGAQGWILSGGPGQASAVGSPRLPEGLLETGQPVLGICYGMQLLAARFGATVRPVETGGEYGRTHVAVELPRGPLGGFDSGATTTVWMSHGDTVEDLPAELEALAFTENGALAAMGHRDRPIYGLQFHPEVSHSLDGEAILQSFLFDICQCEAGWKMADFVESAVTSIRERVGDARVVCGLSGGVDSSVVAALLHRAVGDQLTCVFVDHGLLREQESVRVREIFEDHFGVDLRVVDASERFLTALQGVRDPERKRKVIGELFIRTFEAVSEELKGAKFLAQGTLYPDVIESVSAGGPSVTIKTHHNVGGLPEELDFELIEPLRELFKDEVRELGRELGLPRESVDRHPFPGPGLAIRILGEVTPDRVERLRQADHIYISALREDDLYDEVWQAFAVLLPIQTVGVMGDQRTYEEVVALRAVTSRDGMTADRAHLPMEFLGKVSDRIINRVRGINRVVYDVTSKPPATIEWE